MLIRFLWINSFEGEGVLNLAAQALWINVIYEVIAETITLQFFHFLQSEHKNNKNTIDGVQNETKSQVPPMRVVVLVLIVSFTLNFVVTSVLWIWTEDLIRLMSYEHSLSYSENVFLKMEGVSQTFFCLLTIVVKVYLLMKRNRFLIIVFFTQACAYAFFDVLFVTKLIVDLDLGAMGLALSSLLVNLVPFIFLTALLLFGGWGPPLPSKRFLARKFFVMAWPAMLESFVRNFFFALVVLRIINSINSAGSFWTVMSFYWSFILLAGNAVAEYFQMYTVTKDKSLNKYDWGFFVLLLAAIWIIIACFIPLWTTFMSGVLKTPNTQEIFTLALMSFPFYFIYSFNNLADNFLLAKGRANYLVVQAIIVNVIYYGIIGSLYEFANFRPTLEQMTLIFSAGMLFDSFVTFTGVFYYLKIRKERIMNENKLQTT